MGVLVIPHREVFKMSEKSRHKNKAYPLRMSAELREWMQGQADKNERSLNSEIKIAIRAYKEKEETQKSL